LGLKKKIAQKMSKACIKRVVSGIQKLYPIALADKSWDNTGLLVDASEPGENEGNDEKVNILLAIDLTQNVCDEAIKHKTNVIMAYHPFIFRGLKSITPQDPQQSSLIKLIKNNISVYCPHTAVDSAKGGVNDFLGDGIVGDFEQGSREVIEPNEQYEDCGMGRLITLSKPIELNQLVSNVKKSLNLAHVQVALARNETINHQISTIAICAGSGGSVFKGVNADLYYTGELSHHEALYFTESGSSVITTNHSNSERAFLSALKEQLVKEIDGANIVISEEDKDPFSVY
jgi:dinuclear metal center YbgI/SA1388 family protein